MNYLVTGGAGFIGSHLTEYLLSQGHHVTVLDDLSTGQFANLKLIQDHPHFRIIIGSVLDEPLLEPLVRDADGIFHLASAVGVRLIMEQPVTTIETIFQGTDRVLKFSARYRRKVIIASSSEVYGKSEDIPFREDGDRVEGPTTLHRWAYACAKSLDEFLALAHWKKSGLPVAVVRLFNTVGPRQSGQYGMVVPRFVDAALLGQSITVYGDGEQSRCFCHVLDVIRALAAVMESAKCNGQVINVGSTEEISISRLAERVIAMVGSTSKISLLSYDRAFPEGGFEDMRRRVPSTEKVRMLIDWQPQHALDKVLADVIAERRRVLAL